MKKEDKKSKLGLERQTIKILGARTGVKAGVGVPPIPPKKATNGISGCICMQ